MCVTSQLKMNNTGLRAITAGTYTLSGSMMLKEGAWSMRPSGCQLANLPQCHIIEGGGAAVRALGYHVDPDLDRIAGGYQRGSVEDPVPGGDAGRGAEEVGPHVAAPGGKELHLHVRRPGPGAAIGLDGCGDSVAPPRNNGRVVMAQSSE